MLGREQRLKIKCRLEAARKCLSAAEISMRAEGKDLTEFRRRKKKMLKIYICFQKRRERIAKRKAKHLKKEFKKQKLAEMRKLYDAIKLDKQTLKK